MLTSSLAFPVLAFSPADASRGKRGGKRGTPAPVIPADVIADAAKLAADATTTDATTTDAADLPSDAAPAPDAAAPVSARAARLARAAEHIAAGAHRPNVRTTTTVRIPTGLDKYNFAHLAGKPIAERVAGLPAGTQAFYLANARAYAGRDADAGQLDNAKLARCITAGLATIVAGPTRPNNGPHIVADAMRVTFAEPPKA
jgi:hypothetical protein